MKILHLINSLNTGGAEKLLLESLPIYNKNNQVDLLLLDGTEHPFLIKLKDLNCCNIYHFRKKSIYSFSHIFKIISFFKKYDVIHAHLFPSLYWLALAKKISFSNTKIIYTEHSTNNRRRNNIYFKILDKIIYNSYSKIITIAEKVDTNIKNHLNFKSNKFQLINNGVDTSIYRKALPYKKKIFFYENDIIIIQVSSFRKQKNQATLIRALKRLPTNYKLLLVGEGPLLDKNKQLVTSLNLEKRVKFLGIRMDVPRLLKTADIVILSSHHEGLSLSSIEAMASERPFIASDVPGLKEIVNNAGILFPKYDETILAKHVIELSTNKKYYNLIVEKCLKRAAQYDINKMVEQYLNLYKNLLKK